MHRLKQTAAIVLVFMLLLTWAILNAGIAAEEVEQVKVGAKLTTIATNCKQVLSSHATEKKVTQVSTGPSRDPDAVCLEKVTNVPKTDHYDYNDCIDIHVDQYLAWQANPEAWAKLVRWGRALTIGCQPPDMLFPTDPALIEACCIAYDSARLRCFLELYHRTASPYYGGEVEVVRYLRSRGRDWFTAITIMELESTCGIHTSNHYGILDDRFDDPGDLEDYCDYLYNYQVVEPEKMGYRGGFSNNLPDIATVFNDHAEWRANLYQLAGDLRTWYP